jgi:hypothetical protein
MLTTTGALRAQYSFIVVAATAVIVAIFAIWYTESRLERADQRWCALLAIQAATDPPPSTPRGVTTRNEARRLSAAFECKETPR